MLTRGPPKEFDIIDEAIRLFRPYSFYKVFEIKYPSDRVLVYLILYIQECLELISSKMPPYSEGSKLLKSHALKSFSIPGESMFPLNNIYEKPDRIHGG